MRQTRSGALLAARVRKTSLESWMGQKRLAPLAAFCMLCAVPAAATTINLSTTAANTAGYTIASDTNCISGSPASCGGGSTEGTTIHAVSDVGPLSWIPNGTVSDGTTTNGVWIAPIAVQDGPSGNGTTVYDVSFSLPSGFTGITLLINLSADDYVTVVLNPAGSNTAVFTPTTGQKTSGMWTTSSGTRSITSGFAVGTNTLQFTVPNNNADTTSSCCGPTGLLVDADVSFTTTTTPEPGSLALIGTGLLALGFRRARRR